jgi:hypothetical protein
VRYERSACYHYCTFTHPRVGLEARGFVLLHDQPVSVKWLGAGRHIANPKKHTGRVSASMKASTTLRVYGNWVGWSGNLHTNQLGLAVCSV